MAESATSVWISQLITALNDRTNQKKRENREEMKKMVIERRYYEEQRV